MLKDMSPSSIDFEIRSLSPMDDLEQFKAFIVFILSQIETNRNFEITQAYLNVFLQVVTKEKRKNEKQKE